ncbi:hypothetical protein [Falsiroseomonas oryziterrae]|uniref:hypothetical protein n=1 Tax=Falsiroseomonas oryziterrae TaxID=2911368 RepID=UPI001F173E2C|nr:hypothetical protein [Roseomonas sp. NPKOSM-4]
MKLALAERDLVVRQSRQQVVHAVDAKGLRLQQPQRELCGGLGRARDLGLGAPEGSVPGMPGGYGQRETRHHDREGEKRARPALGVAGPDPSRAGNVAWSHGEAVHASPPNTPLSCSGHLVAWLQSTSR